MYSLIALLTGLAVGVILFARREQTRGSAPLAWLCFVLAVWHLGDFLWSLTRDPAWRVVSALGSAAPAPILVHVFAAARDARGMRRGLLGFYGLSGVFLLGTSLAFFDEHAYELVRSATWVGLYVAVLLVPMLLALAWSVRALRAEGDPTHRLRLRWWLAGATIGVGGGLFDLARLSTHAVPPGMGAIGTTLALLCLAWTVDLGGASERALATRSALLAIAVATIAAFVTLGVSRATAGRTESVVAVGGAIAIGALVAFRVASVRLQREAMRLQALALLGTFSAEVAHEARNPLAAIRARVQLLAAKIDKGVDPATFREHLELIDREVGRLDSVVSDYQALARRGSVPNERASVTEIVRDLMALQGPTLPPTVTLRMELDESIPPVRADSARLRQALLNLLRNAVSAMPEGGTLTVRTAVDGRAKVLVEVEDTGVGISASDLPKIFQPLYTRRAGGSGLGLAVTQRIVEEHGGSVGVRSQPGRGSTFTITLPADPNK